MAGASRWEDDPETKALEEKLKKEKELKKRLKLEKQRQQQQQQEEEQAAVEAESEQPEDRPVKKRKTEERSDEPATKNLPETTLQSWAPCRNISNFDTLNAIEEGTYGWVSRARDLRTGEVVALKKLKMEYATEGFPVTALREIRLLQESKHRHIVDLKEVVMGDTSNDVYMVMEFMDHDLKTLLDDKLDPFSTKETKTLLLQLTSAIQFLHDHWILHRDLKTSNILLDNHGALKIADFGMSRRTSNPPPPNLTQLVVTLWYRAPELLLGAPVYDSAIDMWSVGCIFGELLLNTPLLQGSNEVDQLGKIFELCGVPTAESWPGFRRLPNAKSLRLPALHSSIRARFPILTAAGSSLLSSLLALNPAKRPSAGQVLEHAWFREKPLPLPQVLFPTFPSKAAQERRKRQEPHAPKRGEKVGEMDFGGIFAAAEEEQKGAGFSLRMN